MVVLCLAVESEDFGGVFVDESHSADIVRCWQLTGRHAGYQQLAHPLPAVGLHQPEVQVSHVVGNAHFGLTSCPGAVFVIVAECVGQGNVGRVMVLVLGVVLPGAVRRFVVAHQHERPGCVTGFEPVQRLVGDDVGDIARVADRPAGFVEHRVVVVALAGHYGPVVKACGLMRRAFAQVPFAENGGLVAAAAQVLGYVGQPVVDAVGQRHDAVHMVVGAGQNRRATGGADGVADIAVVHPHALLGQAVDVGGLVDAMPVTADGLGRMVVGHDENNIR